MNELWNNRWIKLVSYFVVPICVSIVGLLLMLMVYLIPTGRIERNLQDSAGMMKNESEYLTLMYTPNSTLDNYTDALMLLTAAHPNHENILKSTVKNYRYAVKKSNPYESLIKIYVKGKTQYKDRAYARYWHGYLLWLKPMLFLWNYGTIRSLIMFVQLLLFVATICQAFQKEKILLMPIFISWIFMNPLSTMMSLQFNTVICIAFLALNIILFNCDRWDCLDFKWNVLFLLIGCLTSYMDLLTFPIVTLGLPLVLWVVLFYENNIKKNFLNMVRFIIPWSIGYSVMWGLKWVYATLFGDENIIVDAINTMKYRLSGTLPNGVVPDYKSVLRLQYLAAKQPAWEFFMALLIIVAVYLIIRHKSFDVCCVLSFLLLGVLPLFWYVLLKNHSQIHSFFTYRDLAVTIFSVNCGILMFIQNIGGGIHGSNCNSNPML